MEKFPKISYLISCYPAISHTFILKEVLYLKSKGFKVNTASINLTNRTDQRLTDEERQEKSITYYIKAQGILGAIRSIFYCSKKYPMALVKALFYAIKLGGSDIKHSIYNLFYFVEACIVVKWMDENQSESLHIHFGSEVATVGLFVKKLNGCKLSIYIHGPDEFYNVTKYYLEEKIAIANKIYCISDFARSQMMQLSNYKYWHKFEVCRLGVDTDAFSPVAKRPQEVKTILSIGRLCPAKGQHILLSAAKETLDAGHRFKLIIVGDGEDKESLQSFSTSLGLDDHVEFTGAVNHDEVHRYYKQADIFCLPSFAEGIPIVLMEAMAQEIACVTTRITGIPELISDGEDGILVAPSDVAGLNKAILRLLNDNELRNALGKAAREKIMNQYDVKENTDYFSASLSGYLETKN